MAALEHDRRRWQRYSTQTVGLLAVPNELAVQCVRTQQWLMHRPDTHTHAL